MTKNKNNRKHYLDTEHLVLHRQLHTGSIAHSTRMLLAALCLDLAPILSLSYYMTHSS